MGVIGRMLLLSAVAAAAQTGTVAGHVFCADTQTPCRFANVVLQGAPAVKNGSVVSGSSGGFGGSFSGQTDLEGAFQISGVAPGDYYILGRLQGYISAYDLAVSEFPNDATMKAQALEAGLSRISVEANQTTVANLTLARGASLSGTAQFDDGGVASGLAVHLFRKNTAGKWIAYVNSAGASRMSPLGFASRTDDRGHFYEPGLAPGTYTFAVTLPEVRLVPSGITGRQTLNVRASNGDALEVFDGNTYRLREAAAVELRAGEDRVGADITVPTHGLHTLRGYVSAGTAGSGRHARKHPAAGPR